MKISKKALVFIAVLLACIVILLIIKVDYKKNNDSQISNIDNSQVSLKKKIVGYDTTKDLLVTLEKGERASNSIIPVHEVSYVSGNYPAIINDQKNSPDGYIFYSVYTKRFYENSEDLEGTPVFETASFRFDKKTRIVDLLFDGKDVPFPNAIAIDVSSDGSLVFYNLKTCSACDGPPDGAIIVNIESKIKGEPNWYKDIGKVVNFKFTGPSTYQYNEALSEMDDSCDSEACSLYKPGTFRTGKF